MLFKCTKCGFLHYQTDPCKVAKKSDSAGSPPSSASKGGRPRIHPDRKAYKAEHERKRRAAQKEAK